MKICLINPPVINSVNEGVKNAPSVRDVQSLGLGYIAAMLEKHGYAVDVLECSCADLTLDSLVNILKERQYDLIGISTFIYNVYMVVKIARKIKQVCPEAFFFIGGYYPTLCTEEAFGMMPNLDCCVLGEGEYTCLELIQALDSGEDFRKIPGLAYKNGTEVVQNPLRPLINNLDILPFPKVTYLSKYKIAPIISSRGCYGTCTYCATLTYTRKFVGSKVRRRSVENTVAEMKYLATVHGVEYFAFQDDIFLENSPAERERIKQFCQLLKEANLQCNFMVSVRPNDILSCQDMLKELMTVGLDSVFVGSESFVERQLKLYSKMVTVAENKTAAMVLNELGLTFTLGLIIYEPFTTIDDVLENIQNLREIKYDDSPYCHGMPISMKGTLAAFYGCPLYKLLQDKELLTNTEIGFKFVDSNMDVLYQAKEVWAEKITPTANQLWELLNYAIYKNEQSLVAELMQLKVRLTRLDLDIMENFCQQIKEGVFSLADVQGNLTPWLIELTELKNHLAKFADLLGLKGESKIEVRPEGL